MNISEFEIQRQLLQEELRRSAQKYPCRACGRQLAPLSREATRTLLKLLVRPTPVSDIRAIDGGLVCEKCKKALCKSCNPSPSDGGTLICSGCGGELSPFI